MSMLTAQCDRLRKRAAELRQGRWSDGADDAALMDDAADTIEGLRDRLTDTKEVETCRFNVVVDQDPTPRRRGNICECDACGYRCACGFIVDQRFKFCPNCGRKVMNE